MILIVWVMGGQEWSKPRASGDDPGQVTCDWDDRT